MQRLAGGGLLAAHQSAFSSDRPETVLPLPSSPPSCPPLPLPPSTPPPATSSTTTSSVPPDVVVGSLWPEERGSSSEKVSNNNKPSFSLATRTTSTATTATTSPVSSPEFEEQIVAGIGGGGRLSNSGGGGSPPCQSKSADFNLPATNYQQCLIPFSAVNTPTTTAVDDIPPAAAAATDEATVSGLSATAVSPFMTDPQVISSSTIDPNCSAGVGGACPPEAQKNKEVTPAVTSAPATQPVERVIPIQVKE